jgi:hypothetical protein
MSDLEMAVETLKEEIEGISWYKQMFEDVTCPELKKIVYDNTQAEKIHVQNLLRWINTETNKQLG